MAAVRAEATATIPAASAAATIVRARGGAGPAARPMSAAKRTPRPGAERNWVRAADWIAGLSARRSSRAGQGPAPARPGGRGRARNALHVPPCDRGGDEEERDRRDGDMGSRASARRHPRIAARPQAVCWDSRRDTPPGRRSRLSAENWSDPSDGEEDAGNGKDAGAHHGCFPRRDVAPSRTAILRRTGAAHRSAGATASSGSAFVRPRRAHRGTPPPREKGGSAAARTRAAGSPRPAHNVTPL